jgi:hypothetical protein
MVKEQNLALNPTKISGICGRLMCCMGFEHNTYRDLWKNLPSPGSKIKTPSANYIVSGVDVAKEKVRIYCPGSGEILVDIEEFQTFRETVMKGEVWTSPETIAAGSLAELSDGPDETGNFSIDHINGREDSGCPRREMPSGTATANSKPDVPAPGHGGEQDTQKKTGGRRRRDSSSKRNQNEKQKPVLKPQSPDGVQPAGQEQVKPEGKKRSRRRRSKKPRPPIS